MKPKSKILCIAPLVFAISALSGCDRGMDGGPCMYEEQGEHVGEVTEVEPTGDEADAPLAVTVELDDGQSCSLYAYPEYGDDLDSVQVGAELDVVFLVITSGACSPETYEVRGVELTVPECV